jgi:hypothetical protein
LIITGIIWLVVLWQPSSLRQDPGCDLVGMSVLGSVIAVLLGTQNSKRVRSSSTSVYVKRILIFWISLIFFALPQLQSPNRQWEADHHVHYPVHHARPICHGNGAFLLLKLWQCRLRFGLVGYLFFPNIFYLWMGFWSGLHDRTRAFDPFQVVEHG